VVFVAASLLSNVRSFKATYLTSVPSRYRHDAHNFRDALGHALSRYLGGLALVLAIQGVLSAMALFLIGVPYPLALGAWVSITAVIPYLGAWLGAIPALLVAFTISPSTAALTGLLFLAIQQLEGNVLTPGSRRRRSRCRPSWCFWALSPAVLWPGSQACCLQCRRLRPYG
jgi:predicted PurR-regulated permease PerM